MLNFKKDELVCFIDSCELPEFYGGVYRVVGYTMKGMLSGEISIDDNGAKRRVAAKYLRRASHLERDLQKRIHGEGV